MGFLPCLIFKDRENPLKSFIHPFQRFSCKYHLIQLRASIHLLSDTDSQAEVHDWNYHLLLFILMSFIFTLTVVLALSFIAYRFEFKTKAPMTWLLYELKWWSWKHLADASQVVRVGIQRELKWEMEVETDFSNVCMEIRRKVILEASTTRTLSEPHTPRRKHDQW